MAAIEVQLARVGNVLQVAAAQRATARRQARRRRAALIPVLGALVLSAAALAGSGPLAGVLPNLSGTRAPVVPSSTLSPDLAQLADLQQIHAIGPARFGMTPYLAPALAGGVCVFFKSAGTNTYGTCTANTDLASDSIDGRIGEGPGAIYVGLRPDGVVSLTAVDGSAVPVTNNVYISDLPIAKH